MSRDLLHLVIPGLLGPWPQAGAGFPLPEAPALGRLLGRARAEEGARGLEATLFRLFGLPEEGALPVAPVTRLAEGDGSDSGWWLRADPVHLKADLRQVLLFDARHLDISPAEAQALATEFNATFGPDGLQLEVPHPQRWYLRLDRPPALRACPLSQAVGRDINDLLPRGAEAGRWRTRLTEIQMLFHGAAVNQKREAKGLPAINSVWFWGGGRLPLQATAPAAGLYGDEVLLRGLARLAGVPVGPAPAGAGDWRQAAAGEISSLVMLDPPRFAVLDNQPFAWAEQVSALETDWFAPLAGWLGDRLRELRLYPCNGRVYCVGRGDLRRFWRRPRTLDSYLGEIP